MTHDSSARTRSPRRRIGLSRATASAALAPLALAILGACAHAPPSAAPRPEAASAREAPSAAIRAPGDSAPPFRFASAKGDAKDLVSMRAAGRGGDRAVERRARADLIERAIQRDRETGVARAIRAGGALVLPFGHGQPVISCAVLRACVLELESGERMVNDPIAGDQARWIIETARTGVDGRNTLVVVKPKECDITTNLVVSTDRRVYDVTLDAPACASRATNPKPEGAGLYTGRVRFYYPDDPPRDVAPGRTSMDTGERKGESTSAGALAGGEPAERAEREAPLNRDYRIVERRVGPFGLFAAPADFPWTPEAIWDDGAHVTIVLPRSADGGAAPVLYALEADGTRTMVNYALRDRRVVTDRTFRRGLLVIRSGARERRLEFENRSWGRPPARSAGGDVAARVDRQTGGR